ncbi:aminotransferase class V-fold PLP-dependent enzyme, partial [Clostridium tertium]|uniref:aminotransferase class V-fold PLP-dependent enzyme n=1 Tax=Clostridium tertium TaxID=1559 RepID=UPI00241E2CBE
DELMKYFIDEIRKLSYIKIYGNNSLNERSAVVSFNIDGVDASIVGEELNEYGIAVRTGYHCTPLIHDIIGTEYAGTVRVSPGCFNVLQDIDELLEYIRKIYNSR